MGLLSYSWIMVNTTPRISGLIGGHRVGESDATFARTTFRIPLPPRPSADLAAAPWWAEFLAVKDGLSWGALAARFGVNGTHLQRALADVGLTKTALPPGRKPKAAPQDEVLVPPAPEVGPQPEDLLWRYAGKQPDGEVAIAAGVSVDDVKTFRRAHSIAAHLRPPPGVSLPTQTAPPPVKSALPPGGFVVRRTSTPGQPVQEVRRPIPAPEPPTVALPPIAPPTRPARANPLERFRSQLGKVGDHVIAARAGVTRESVGKFRRDNAIPAYDGFRTGPRQRPDPVAQVEPVPPSPSVTPPSTPPHPPGRRSAIDAFADLLGTVPDHVVGAMAGVSRDAVKEYRKRRGIGRFYARPQSQTSNQPEAVPPAATAPRAPVADPGVASAAATTVPNAARVPLKRHRASKIDAFADLVGVLPDRTVASRAGVTVGNVQAWRTRRGIPPHGAKAPVTEPTAPTHPEPTVAPPADSISERPASQESPESASAAPVEVASLPAPPAAAPTPSKSPVRLAVAEQDDIDGEEPDLPALTAYRLRAVRGAETHEFFIVADDIGDAGVRAVSALSRRRDGPWRVVAIRELGEALD